VGRERRHYKAPSQSSGATLSRTLFLQPASKLQSHTMPTKRRRKASRPALLLMALPFSTSSSVCNVNSIGTAHAYSPAPVRSNVSVRVACRNQQNPALVNEKQFLHQKRQLKLRLHASGLRGGSLQHVRGEGSGVAVSNDVQRRQRGMTVALMSTYFAVMGAKCALPSVLSLLTSPTNGLTFSGLTTTTAGGPTPQILMAKLLGLSTLAVAMGKLLLGPLIDKLGGIRSLQVALLTLALLVLVITCTQQFSIFAVCWVFVDFIFSSCWAGCINAIHQSFPKDQWGRQIGFLAAGARTGNAVAFALFASILYAMEHKMKQPWRVVFGVSALLQFLPIALLTYFGESRATTTPMENQSSRPSIRDSLATLRREASTAKFWCHLVSRSCLMVFASFLLFVPTLMSQVYGSSNAFAAQTGSIYALGCLLSVTTGSELYSKLPRKGKALSIAAMLLAATISSMAQLAHVAGLWKLSSAASAAFLFLWGWAFAIPFYIPPSLYALERGGSQSSATIADVFDIGGFAFLALFNGYVASIQHANPAAWIPTFIITTACSTTSLVALTLAVLLK
jgi:Major Facilitator Superfamily